MKIVLCTVPAGSAKTLASTLVEERLAACVNVIAGVASVYRWRGALETGEESLLVAKTSDATLPSLMKRIRELHEYDTPEIVALEVSAVDPRYLAWVDEETASQESSKEMGSHDDEGVERGTAPRTVSPVQEEAMKKKKKPAKKAAKKSMAKKTKKRK